MKGVWGPWGSVPRVGKGLPAAGSTVGHLLNADSWVPASNLLGRDQSLPFSTGSQDRPLEHGGPRVVSKILLRTLCGEGAEGPRLRRTARSLCALAGVCRRDSPTCGWAAGCWRPQCSGHGPCGPPHGHLCPGCRLRVLGLGSLPTIPWCGARPPVGVPPGEAGPITRATWGLVCLLV